MQGRKVKGEFDTHKRLIDREQKFHDYDRVTRNSFNVSLDKIEDTIVEQYISCKRSYFCERLTVHEKHIEIKLYLLYEKLYLHNNTFNGGYNSDIGLVNVKRVKVRGF